MAKLQETSIFGNLTVTGSTIDLGNSEIANYSGTAIKLSTGDCGYFYDTGVVYLGKGDNSQPINLRGSNLLTSGTSGVDLAITGDLTVTGNTISGSSGVVIELETTRLVAKGGGDAGGGSASGRFIVGATGTIGAHICMDENEILAKSDATTMTQLHIQTDGGTLTIGQNTACATNINLGTFALPNGTTINEFSIDGTMAGDSDDAVPTEKAVKAYVASAGGGPGSGTAWDLPVWSTTSTLGDSMVKQDSGGTTLTIDGSKVVLGNGAAEYTYLRHYNSTGSCYMGLAYATNNHVTGSVAGDYVISCRTGSSIIFSADSSYAQIHMEIDEDGDTRCNVNNYFDIKPATDTYGLIIRDSGSDSYYVNMKNVNGDVYIGDTTSTNADMIKIAGTALTVPGTFSAGAAGFDVNSTGSITDCGSIAMGGALTGVTTIDASSTIRGTGLRVDGAVAGTAGTATVSYVSTGSMLRIYCAANTNYLDIDVNSTSAAGETILTTAANNHITISPHSSYGCHFKYKATGHIFVTPESDNTGYLGDSSNTWNYIYVTNQSSADIVFANDMRMSEVAKPGHWYDGDVPGGSDKPEYARDVEKDGETPGLVWKDNKGGIIAVLDENGDFFIKGKVRSLDEWAGMKEWRKHVAARAS